MIEYMKSVNFCSLARYMKQYDKEILYSNKSQLQKCYSYRLHLWLFKDSM